MSAKRTSVLKAGIILFILVPFFVCAPVYGQNFQSNSYDVDMAWKVSGRYLRVYGNVEDGRPCWKLKVQAKMGNRIHNVSADVISYTEQHYPGRRTPFAAKSDLGRDYKAVKGWYAEKVSVYCVGKP